MEPCSQLDLVKEESEEEVNALMFNVSGSMVEVETMPAVVPKAAETPQPKTDAPMSKAMPKLPAAATPAVADDATETSETPLPVVTEGCVECTTAICTNQGIRVLADVNAITRCEFC